MKLFIIMRTLTALALLVVLFLACNQKSAQQLESSTATDLFERESEELDEFDEPADESINRGGMNSKEMGGIFDQLLSHDYAEITVKTDLTTLVNNKVTSNEYIEGKFGYEPLAGVEETLPVRIRCRGRFRRMKCEFPPLKLKFKKKDLAAHGLNEFNELKLVTHCVGEKEVSRDLIMRELLAYRIFNILSENSLRAQLVKVNYVNTNGRPKKLKGWGILIEDSDELAYRLQGDKYWKMGLPRDSFDLRQEQMTSMFNYMIGNCDWSCQMARNLEFIRKGEKIMVIPYDFDFAGMVQAPYAVPNMGIGQKKITDRVYMGSPAEIGAVTEIVEHFKNKKEAIMQVVKGAKLLSAVSKKEVSDYISSFYDSIEQEEILKAVASGSSE